MLRKKVKAMKECWLGPSARQIPRIPEKPVREEFVEMPKYGEIKAGHRYLAAGYDYEDADVYAFDLVKNHMFLVTGSRGSGKSVLMKNLILNCLDRGEECIVIEQNGTVYSRICDEQSLRRAETAQDIDAVMRYLHVDVMRSRIALKKEILKSYAPEEEMFERACVNRRVNLFIADLNKLVEVLYDETSAAYGSRAALNLIAEKGALYNVFMFAEVRDADQQNLELRPVVNEIKAQCIGVRLGGRFSDNLKLLKFENIGYRDKNVVLKPGVGIVSSEGSNSKIEKFVVPMYRG